MIFTNMVNMLRPISFARRDGDSLICAWHFYFAAVNESHGLLPIPSSDGKTIDMEINPNAILRLASCAPRRTSSGSVFRYTQPTNKPIALAGVFRVRQVSSHNGGTTITLSVNAGMDGHGHCFSRRILSPRQLDYPVKCENVNDHRWVNLVQDIECPGHGWIRSQMPAGLIFPESGHVILQDHHVWYREGPLEYPDCLFDE